MKHLRLHFYLNNRRYIHSAITGQLYSAPAKTIPAITLPRKVERALELCEHPYRLPPLSAPEAQSNSIGPAKAFADRLIRLCCFNFWLAVRYASQRKIIHRDAADAINTFRATSEPADQKNLCLPRSLYAAKTSQRFEEHGVVFIGIFLPSRAMHAWVIEGSQLADPQDSEWLHHRPVAALY